MTELAVTNTELHDGIPSTLVTRGLLAITPIGLCAGVVLSHLVSSNLLLSLMTQAVIGAILSTGVGVLYRQNGVVSFGHAAFYGSAAYIVGLATRHGVASIEATIILALVLPTLAAFLLGLVIVRVPGTAFAMLTIAIGQALFEFANKARDITGGDEGFRIEFPATIFGTPTSVFQKPGTMFLLCWAVLVLILCALHVFSRSPFGRLTVAIRENQERAQFIGYTTLIPRAMTYALSALIGAVAGVLAMLYNGFVSPDSLHVSVSSDALIMAVIGGLKFVWGPAAGAVVFFFVKEIAGDVTEHWPAILGIIVIVTSLWLRGGLAGALTSAAGFLRHRLSGTEP